ncbi:hypothetical protein [Wenyingzhuangia sp. IMCC45467]
MKLERKTTMVKVMSTLLVLVSVACTTKKEAEPVKKTAEPVVVEKTKVVKETLKPVNVITYGVQIGAYKKYDVDFGSEIKNIKHNGLSNYVFGNFKTQQEAEECLKIMKDLSIKDAFVVTMKDGEIME